MTGAGLSRIYSAQLMTIIISILQIDLLDMIKGSWLHDEKLQSLIQGLSTGHHYQWTQNMLYKKGKLVVGSDLPLQQHIIHLFHDSPLGGHSRVMVTKKKKVGSLFY